MTDRSCFLQISINVRFIDEKNDVKEYLIDYIDAYEASKIKKSKSLVGKVLGAVILKYFKEKSINAQNALESSQTRVLL